MAAAGMHAQLWADLDLCADTAVELARHGMPLVLDHLAGLSPADHLGSYRFDKLLNALSSGLVWIKLTYLRRSAQPLDYRDMRGTIEALVAAAPNQLLWGSDWPFVRLAAAPDPASLLDQLQGWLGREAFARCMVENPARLLAAPKSLDDKTPTASN
jgi:predicted TIM-barrel fold metal-dependent hydrolase